MEQRIEQTLAKTLTVAQLASVWEQFTLLGPNKNGFISMQNFKMVSSFPNLIFSYFNTLWSHYKYWWIQQGMVKNSIDAMKDSWALDYANMVML